MTKKRLSIEEEIAQARAKFNNMTEEEKIAYLERQRTQILAGYAGTTKESSYKRKVYHK